MTPPPDSPAVPPAPIRRSGPTALEAITTFDRDLVGTVGPAAVIGLLVKHLKATFGPSHLAVGALAADGKSIEIQQVEGGSATQARAWLEAAREQGVTRLTPGDPPLCLVAPIPAKRGVWGAVAIGGPSGAYTDDDLALLGSFAATAGVALEGARLRQVLEDAKRSWEGAVDAISLAFLMVDQNGLILRANRACADLLGVPVTSVAGKPWLALIPPGWADGVRAALSGAQQQYSVDLQAGPRIFSVTGFPLRSSEQPRVILIFEDQTDRRKLQAQLIQSEKMSAIGQLIAGVAHDLNNPLASVVGFADFLVESAEVPPRLREPLVLVQQEAERAANIVRNLLQFARKQEYQRRPTAIRPLLSATLGLLRNQLMADKVEAKLELEPDLPELDVDPNQIQQIFVNLINNATQAIASTGRPGSITIRARRWLDGVAIDVIDDGPGMTDANAQRAFEPFFTTKPEGQGTGLGLTITQGIVKEHGGRITLTTTAGKGAVLTVELPRTREGSLAPAPEVEREGGRPLKVLVVDDEPPILHYMQATLEAWGHSVETANDGAEALEVATRGKFDLIITDLRMPRLGGREFYQELQQRAPGIAERVAFSTGDTIRGDTLAFLERQGRPCLHKPFSLAELRRLLTEIALASPSSPTE
ncbi:MAG TPA: ATP-binding protein [Gemmatimonadales bacterium]|nr:ATP-binding protein [Gemmatimonadales bacterium]